MTRVSIVWIFSAMLALCDCMAALPLACPLPGQQRRQAIDFYFGRDIPGREAVTDAEWNDFTARELTPRFPDGLTIFDATGQWLDPRTGRIVHEPSRVVRAVVPPDANLAAGVEAASAAYRTRFHQESVGVVTARVCARF